jgi:hypothetical protein
MTHKDKLKKKLRKWIESEIKAGNYKGIMDACLKLGRYLGLKDGQKIRSYLYGAAYPVAEGHVRPLHKKTGIDLGLMRPSFKGLVEK